MPSPIPLALGILLLVDVLNSIFFSLCSDLSESNWQDHVCSLLCRIPTKQQEELLWLKPKNKSTDEIKSILNPVKQGDGNLE